MSDLRPRHRSRRVAALTAAVALPLSLAAPLLPAPGAAAPTPERRLPPVGMEYVALGDSWTADVVILNRDGVPDTTHAPIDCAQSHRNYPKILAEALSVGEFRDASCGSATTDDFYEPQTGLPLGGTNPPQFDRLSPTTDLVTVGIGGNDAGVASAGLDCLGVIPVDNPVTDSGAGLPFGGCKAKYTADGYDQIGRNIRQSTKKLVRAFRTSATVFIIIAAAGPFSWLLTSLGAIKDLEVWLLSYADSPLLFALVIVTFIYVLGMVMDAAANIIVVGPVLIKVFVAAGYPEVQGALICVVGFLIGTVTPPLGVGYFTAAAIARASLESVAVAMLPYLVALFGMLFLLVVVPDFTMWLPTLWGFVQ